MKDATVNDDRQSSTSCFLSDLAGSEMFRSAVASLMRHDSFEPETLIQEIASAGDPQLAAIVGAIEKACIADIENSTQIESRFINILHHCCVYYESIAATEELLRLGSANLSYSELLGDSNIIRRAHLIVAAGYALDCKFNDAFSQNYCAYQIAVNNRDIVGTLMALVNTVIVLQAMGLIEDALKLTLHLARTYPFDGERLACLQIVNASNGMRLSYLLNDYDSAEELYELSLRVINKNSKYLTNVNIINYKAALMVRLAARGRNGEFQSFEKQFCREAGKSLNLRVLVFFSCAQADAYLLLKDQEKLKASRILIQSLIEKTETLPHLQRELLQQLIKIDQFNSKRSHVVGERHQRQYRQMLKVVSLKTKHREYFHHAARGNGLSDTTYLKDPSYELPPWIFAQIKNLNLKSTFAEHKENSSARAKRVPFDILTHTSVQSVDFAAKEFSTVENWAIAVECAVGGDGYNGLRVSHLAVAIAQEMGNFTCSMPMFFRACRLFDIGKVVIAFSSGDISKSRAFGRFSIFSQHTVVGARLLRSSENEVMQLASRIAEGHHEWWNGCGYPLGLKTVAIPIEARVCAVSDFIVSLLLPSDGSRPWSLADAVHQVSTMAGVQFDPDVCSALIRVVNNDRTGWWKKCSSFEPSHVQRFAELLE